MWLIKLLLPLGLGWLLKRFLPSRDRELGRAESERDGLMGIVERAREASRIREHIRRGDVERLREKYRRK